MHFLLACMHSTELPSVVMIRQWHWNMLECLPCSPLIGGVGHITAPWPSAACLLYSGVCFFPVSSDCDLLLTKPMGAWQVESGIAMQNLKPTIDNIKRLYGDDKKKVQRETSELYKKAQISPLAGKLRLLCTVPIHPLHTRRSLKLLKRAVNATETHCRHPSEPLARDARLHCKRFQMAGGTLMFAELA